MSGQGLGSGVWGLGLDSPLELKVPSSYVRSNTRSTKSRGEMSFIAAEGVVVLLMISVCGVVGGR